MSNGGVRLQLLLLTALVIGGGEARSATQGTPAFTLNGTAQYVANGTDGAALRLTPATNNVVGSAFTTTRLDASAFSLRFDFKMGAWTGGGEFAFVIQSVSDRAVGRIGDPAESIGSGRSAAVVFSPGDPGGGRLAGVIVSVNGERQFVASMPWLNATTRTGTAWIDYNGESLFVRVAPDRNRPLLTFAEVPLDLDQALGTHTAFLGFTAVNTVPSSAYTIERGELMPLGTHALRALVPLVEAASLPAPWKQAAQSQLGEALAHLPSESLETRCARLNPFVDALSVYRDVNRVSSLSQAVGLLTLEIRCRATLPARPVRVTNGSILTSRSDAGVFELHGPALDAAGYVSWSDMAGPSVSSCQALDTPCRTGDPVAVDTQIRLNAGFELHVGPWALPSSQIDWTVEYLETPRMDRVTPFRATGVLRGRFGSEDRAVLETIVTGHGHVTVRGVPIHDDQDDGLEVVHAVWLTFEP